MKKSTYFWFYIFPGYVLVSSFFIGFMLLFCVGIQHNATEYKYAEKYDENMDRLKSLENSALNQEKDIDLLLTYTKLQILQTLDTEEFGKMCTQEYEKPPYYMEEISFEDNIERINKLDTSGWTQEERIGLLMIYKKLQILRTLSLEELAILCGKERKKPLGYMSDLNF